ncbi:probable LRR receptor-like serine/threonine-protein kinase At1g51810 isoform X2 [Phragmites australis]|uniref:probable LRR receptor-like serine/threonine-protein kinase At1g51810 isoform X2 n=1 Tax=Phragmites australis TaxID=29695 RepID=UPI002D76ED05|nr:probable LRR receptor-like serine/threonine-protein kinase At1g51810 isoform X2 [Phragmites australis]
MAAFLVLFAAMFVLVHAVHDVGQQQGFLSIDCGLNANDSGYTDTSTGIVYVSDVPYVDGGENQKVAAQHQQETPRYNTLRSFPSGERNCYALPTVAGAKYLARTEIFYGNYDGRNISSSSQVEYKFDLYLGTDYWNTLKVGTNVTYEAVFVAWANWTHVCLVNTGNGTPFVSVVELRPLGGALYPPVTPDLSMAMYDRIIMGADTSFTRYQQDRYDRFWYPMDEASPQWASMSTNLTIQPAPNFMEPLHVLQTAIAAAGNGTVLIPWTWEASDSFMGFAFMVFLHFADFQSSQLRQFNIYLNGNQLGSSYSPSSLVASCVYNSVPYNATDGNKYNITLVATAKSVLPPMINALEIYYPIPRNSPATFSTDIDAIMAIKFEYGVKKNWTGDPCYPTIYAWNGVKCSNTSNNTMRITSLDLSNSNLQGAISTNFTLLTALQNLDLSYNNLSGSIPDSLPSLSSLRVLNLSSNHLSSNSLCGNYTGLLIFRHDPDESMCNERISPSRKRALVLVTAVVVCVLVVAGLFLVYFIGRAKRKPNDDQARNLQLENAPRSSNSQGDYLQYIENRRFTYKELEKFTDNFKRFIGQGGFGLVYYGRLEDGTEVAVKMRSWSSSHGLDEFLAEVQSLTKVHHRNLVSLVGYCWERDHLALVYEYMSQGNLYDHLRGKNAVGETLNWGTRVQVMLEAAQGLDYLHKGCSPRIIHRDVKSSNILLGQNLQAKIADLGLSKTYLSDDQTHISTTAAGTAGYIDPEHYLTGRLTERSDVYSFGVVLLEIVTGEPPIVPGHGHIVQRVKQSITTGDIGLVADPRLEGAYDVSSMWKVVDTAMMCTAVDAAGRLTMSDVVAQLKDSLALEEARENEF